MIEELIAVYLPHVEVQDNTADMRGRFVHWHFNGVGYELTIQRPGYQFTERYARPSQIVARLVEIDIEENPHYSARTAN